MYEIQTMQHQFERPKIDTGVESFVQQEFKDECDIRTIIKRFQKTGMVDHIRSNPGVYADLPAAEDYHTYLERVRKTQELFETLPAQVRDELENSPEKMLEMMENPEMHDELVKLGIVDPVYLEDVPGEFPEAAGEPQEVPAGGAESQPAE